MRLIDFTGDRWRVIAETEVYGRRQRAQTTDGQAADEMFQSLRFGQPSLLRLSDEDWLVVHWSIEEGQGRILGRRIRLRP